MNDPKCRSCGLHHRAMIVCSVARRMHASGNLPQPEQDIIRVLAAPPARTTNIINRPIIKPVTGNDSPVTGNAQRQAKFKQSKKKAGMIAITVWGKPEHQEAIKAHAAQLDK